METKGTIEDLGLTDEWLDGAAFDQIPPERPDDWMWEWLWDASPMPPGAVVH
jgi:hypothetical protein